MYKIRGGWEPGFELGPTEPDSTVLPLYYSPKGLYFNGYELCYRLPCFFNRELTLFLFLIYFRLSRLKSVWQGICEFAVTNSFSTDFGCLWAPEEILLNKIILKSRRRKKSCKELKIMRLSCGCVFSEIFI